MNLLLPYFKMYDRPCNWRNYFLAAIFPWRKYDVDFCFNYCFLLHSTAQNSLRLRTSKTQHMMWNLYFFFCPKVILFYGVCAIFMTVLTFLTLLRRTQQMYLNVFSFCIVKIQVIHCNHFWFIKKKVQMNNNPINRCLQTETISKY